MHYHKILSPLTLICIVIVANPQVDQKRAMEYFKEAQTICERENGRLWEVSMRTNGNLKRFYHDAHVAHAY